MVDCSTRRIIVIVKEGNDGQAVIKVFLSVTTIFTAAAVWVGTSIFKVAKFYQLWSLVHCLTFLLWLWSTTLRHFRNDIGLGDSLVEALDSLVELKRCDPVTLLVALLGSSVSYSYLRNFPVNSKMRKLFGDIEVGGVLPWSELICDLLRQLVPLDQQV